MSLSQEPALSVLRNELVCGYRDISKESYAGFSGKHEIGGNAIRTTNGAGPHNMQLFLLAGDGTVLHCLPGYWNPSDLVREVEFAGRLHDVWTSPRMNVTQKRQLFQQMHLAHVREHPFQMVRRSEMQSFDKKYEAKHRLMTSDTIANRNAAQMMLVSNSRPQKGAFKTTDQIMHERMAARPFVPYTRFDVAQYSDYGRPKYDKNENFRDSSGRIADKEGAKRQETLGQKPEKPNRQNRFARRAARNLMRQGTRTVFRGMN